MLLLDGSREGPVVYHAGLRARDSRATMDGPSPTGTACSTPVAGAAPPGRPRPGQPLTTQLTSSSTGRPRQTGRAERSGAATATGVTQSSLVIGSKPPRNPCAAAPRV
ncbi:hypothetical protein Cma02nite_19340 [Cellulomonas marina]|nr:hypothetical protein Cma02nite_19340 [Cellulomonas marina]